MKVTCFFMTAGFDVHPDTLKAIVQEVNQQAPGASVHLIAINDQICTLLCDGSEMWHRHGFIEIETAELEPVA